MRGMYMGTAASRPSLDTAANNHIQSWRYSNTSEDVFGLEKYQVKSLESDPADKMDDLLIERNINGSVESYLHCSPPGKDKVPSCRHRFVDGGIIFQIHWNFSELKEWRARRDDAIAFIKSFEKTHNIKE